jgi:hypothetical protein
MPPPASPREGGSQANAMSASGVSISYLTVQEVARLARCEHKTVRPRNPRRSPDRLQARRSAPDPRGRRPNLDRGLSGHTLPANRTVGDAGLEPATSALSRRNRWVGAGSRGSPAALFLLQKRSILTTRLPSARPRFPIVVYVICTWPARAPAGQTRDPNRKLRQRATDIDANLPPRREARPPQFGLVSAATPNLPIIATSSLPRSATRT